MVGGFLVAVAAVGIFTAYTGATGNRLTSYVVATNALTVGHRIAAGDIATQPMTLPGLLGSQMAFRSSNLLVGALVVEPVKAGELVQASDVASGGSTDRQLSFPIDTSHAVAGTLQPGDRVDVLATYGTGSSASTVSVAQGVTVVSKNDSSGSLADNSNQSEVITLAITPNVDSLALAQAVNTGQVILVRGTGAPLATKTAPYQGPASEVPATQGPANGTGG